MAKTKYVWKRLSTLNSINKNCSSIYKKIWPRESKTFFKDDSIVPRKKLLDTLSEKIKKSQRNQPRYFAETNHHYRR
ncbi:MAG: hypothetical protein DWQ54_16870 [Microcystis flos-aquae TF09]|jgi:hypothetical protein|uniref:Uncharacterized protein n=1 Tax=Microcystis flos-aquae TF09 TaxID=2060473 RepID=A0A3E0L2G2_9CHRO|nr:MAG: hypothetical protein DWQ54_16870 [Microcystis flos-aquae TF09]